MVQVELAETLAVVVDAGSLDAAAQRLHVSTSAISQRIRALENEVGAVLLVRSRPVMPTPAATRLLRFAREVALLRRELDPVPGHRDRELPVAVNADSLATWFLPPLATVAREHGVTLDLYRDDQDHTASLLESGTVAAAVTSRAEPVAGCRVRALGVLRYRAVASPDFVERYFPDGVTAEALTHAPVIDYDARDDLQTTWLQGRGVDPTAPPRHRIPGSHDFAYAVELGFGWALLPIVPSTASVTHRSVIALGGADVDVPLFWQQWNLRSEVLDLVADAVVAGARSALVTATGP